MSNDDFTRGLLEARRRYAQVWADVTGEVLEAVEFTPAYLRAELATRGMERRHLADGVVPVVGQRVVVVREIAERWHLAHTCDGRVHEITSLLGGNTGLVECGPTQFGVAMLKLAPEGAEVTCQSCAGWHQQLERWRIDAAACRDAQFARDELLALVDELSAALRDARSIELSAEVRALLEKSDLVRQSVARG